MAQERNLTLYQTTEICSVPTTTGIYAWFPKITFGALDHKESKGIINEWSIRLGNPKIQLKSDKVHGRAWGASVELKDELETELRTFESEWKTFTEHFNSCFAKLTGPVYVGKAKNLKIRLSQHITVLDNLSKNKNGDCMSGIDAADSESLEDVKNFAERVIAQRNFSVDHLLFTYMELPPEKFLGDRMQAINSDVESVLNKIIRPIFGNR